MLSSRSTELTGRCELAYKLREKPVKFRRLYQLFGKRALVVSVLTFVTQKPDDNFSLAFLLTFKQKKIFSIF